MPEENGLDPCSVGVVLIEEQLLALYMYASLLSDWIAKGNIAPDLEAVKNMLEPRRSRSEQHPNSEDGIATKSEPPSLGLSWPAFEDESQRLSFALRIASTNAILAVAGFFDLLRLSSSRTPEVQFLMHMRDAAANANKFDIKTGEYLPVAVFGGLVVTGKLNGSLLFSDGPTAGFLEFGDTVALLRYLAAHLRSVKSLVSDGDAG
jgi:hypothetical protein